LCSVSNPNRVIDADPNNFATMNLTVGVTGGVFVDVEDTDTTYLAGSRAGFVIEDPGSVLQLTLLQGITLRTYLNGAPRDTASYGELLDLDLIGLTGLSDRTLVTFTTTQTFDEVRIGYSALTGALSSIDVYQSCVDSTP
jgi:hypothetical protein